MKKILVTIALHREPLAELFEKFEVFMPQDKDLKRDQVLEMIPDLRY